LVKNILLAEDLVSLSTLPLTQQAVDELLDLQDYVQTLYHDVANNDRRSLIWGANTYSSSKMYKLAFHSVQAHPIYSWMWKSELHQ